MFDSTRDCIDVYTLLDGDQRQSTCRGVLSRVREPFENPRGHARRECSAAAFVDGNAAAHEDMTLSGSADKTLSQLI